MGVEGRKWRGNVGDEGRYTRIDSSYKVGVDKGRLEELGQGGCRVKDDVLEVEEGIEVREIRMGYGGLLLINWSYDKARGAGWD